jgi:hypothetical protein
VRSEKIRPVQVKFAELRASLATGKTASEHTVPPCDGEPVDGPGLRRTGIKGVASAGHLV